MLPEYRDMWADLYYFFEKCAKASSVLEWSLVNHEANALIKKWDNDVFVVDVVAQTVSYWQNGYGRKE